MRKIFFVTLLRLSIATQIAAQSNNGAIRGVVRDLAKNVIPGVELTLTKTDTKKVYKVTTTGAGAYQFDVPEGVYELRTYLPGFEVATESNLNFKGFENARTGSRTQTGRFRIGASGRWNAGSAIHSALTDCIAVYARVDG